MIRFIDLRGQINDANEPHFAFFSTSSDKFMMFGYNDAQEFSSIDDFTDEVQSGAHPDLDLAKRCLSLIPPDYFSDKK